MSMGDAVEAFSDGFGSTAASVGTLIALGAMFGKLLADSGGADRLVDTIVSRSGPRTLPWSMAAVGALIGLPMFFEIGLVILMPVILLVARRSGQSVIRIGIPTLAGLSVMVNSENASIGTTTTTHRVTTVRAQGLSTRVSGCFQRHGRTPSRVGLIRWNRSGTPVRSASTW